ncbi:peptide/nickel transport system permease protein [Deinobacterium chartae]|uniref:Peptide/nickel transport system permease protein n=1 Tax=Deinobacterium chartae TaxID=521158 RepID=A0A841HW87_9DEIO|nr:ABC transporter permease [Deinobacterium chartae]MBB6097657.1 peptide/nickel transport system permease protein [Deinobacterium chartae]
MSAVSTPNNPAATKTTKSQSQWQIVWKQFRKNPLARWGMGILGVLYLMALFAGFLAPYGLSEYSNDAGSRISWAPPTQVHFVDEQGRLSKPFVYAMKREIDFETFRDKYVPDTSQKYYVKFFTRNPEGSYRFLGLFRSDLKLFGVDAPAKIFLWGSDNLGRDQFSRVMYGSQISLTIGIIATVLTIVFGMIMGGMAGYFRGWIDTLVMRMVEVLVAIPDLFLLITLRALFPLEADPIFIFYAIIGILAAIGWGSIARVVRSQLLSVREQDYVQAAIALGASDARIIGQHMLPNTASFIIVVASLSIPGYILLESGLSFIGIGIVEPYASWGSLLKQAQDGGFESITGRPWTLIPGIFIFLAVLAWQFVGDGLRDAFDPRRRR